MTKEEIDNRSDLLQAALVYCSEQQILGKSGVFTVGERICINQERGAMWSQLEPNTQDPKPNTRYYTVPNTIEEKIQYTIKQFNK